MGMATSPNDLPISPFIKQPASNCLTYPIKSE
jgi:hypothetical protein